MSQPISGFAAKSPKSPLVSFSYDPGPSGGFECEISITHCGLCRSDVHLIDNDWGISRYPFIPGHEIIGTVNAVGLSVENVKKGDRVGVGWQCGACFECEFCREGNEQFCSSYKPTCVDRNGGFADRIIVDARFAFPIPESLKSEHAAPLFCGGLTVFSPLDHFRIGPSSRMGIIGLGGLGHMAVLFGSKMGATVTVFSTSGKKRKDAEKFGASRFVDLFGEGIRESDEETLDFVLSTAPMDLDWMKIISLLRPDGTLCFVGVPRKPLSIPVFSLIDSRKRICGSPIGSRWDTIRMLQFAAKNGVRPQVDLFPLQEINSAIERLRRNEIRYRAVLSGSKKVSKWEDRRGGA